MSVTSIGYTFQEIVDLITDVGGYDPTTETHDLLTRSTSTEMFNEFLDRRINHHEPVAYITNHAKFRNLDLFIDERVLIPRKETEPLVQIAVEELEAGSSVVDVGTGSGAVALAVKYERPDLSVLGVDISKDALDVACINSTALQLEVKWKDADLLDGVKGEFDCVLANLPYLPTTKRDTYAPEMTEHEPQVALWGGEDGFELTRRLLASVRPRRSVKLIALELGLGQEHDVCELVRANGFPTVFCTTDSRGDIRAAVGKR
jgi:release factor glutamine methyltransferase